MDARRLAFEAPAAGHGLQHAKDPQAGRIGGRCPLVPARPAGELGSALVDIVRLGSDRFEVAPELVEPERDVPRRVRTVRFHLPQPPAAPET